MKAFSRAPEAVTDPRNGKRLLLFALLCFAHAAIFYNSVVATLPSRVAISTFEPQCIFFLN